MGNNQMQISKEIKPGKYRHYKGDIVEVIGMGVHSETLEEFVVYKHISGKRVGKGYFWVRPANIFIENVEIEGKTLPRFRRIEE